MPQLLYHTLVVMLRQNVRKTDLKFFILYLKSASNHVKMHHSIPLHFLIKADVPTQIAYDARLKALTVITKITTFSTSCF